MSYTFICIWNFYYKYVVFSSITSESGILSAEVISASSPETPSPVPQKPHPVLQFQLNLLQQNKDCHDIEQLHSLVRKKFTQIMGTHFQPVPTNAEFYYYCPPNLFDDDAEVVYPCFIYQKMRLHLYLISMAGKCLFLRVPGFGRSGNIGRKAWSNTSRNR